MSQEDQEVSHHGTSGKPQRRSRRSRRSGGETVLITSAKRSPLADWRHRRHLYAALQLARIPLFIAAVAVYGWLHNPALAGFIAVISLPLPWIAVLLANDAGDGQPKGTPKVYKPALVREQRARERQALAARAAHLQLDPADRPDPVDGGDGDGHEIIDEIDSDDPRGRDTPARDTHDVEDRTA